MVVEISTHSRIMIKPIFLSTVLILTSFNTLAQNLKLPKIFSDHMVLQRDADIRFWGWADEGTEVTIQLTNASQTTKADNNGRWEALLPAQKAGGPFSVEISTDEETITIEDVYIGDVWLAGGQSNMEWQIGDNINNMEAELNDADYPEIRFIKVAHDIAAKPLKDLKHPAEWKPANKKNAENFSAVAWFFAKRNHLEKDVPVGIIDDNWGGTPAESWAPAKRLLTVEGYQESAAKMLNPDLDLEEKLAKNDSISAIKYQRVEDETGFLKFEAHKPDYDDSNWKEIELPNQEPLTDFIWLRKSFTLEQVSDAKLSFGNPGKFTVAFINGKHVYTKIWSDDPRIIDIDKNILKKGENVIAIRTVEDWNNRAFFGKKGEMWIETESRKVPLDGTWKFSNTIEPPLPEVIRYEHQPGTLFNAMINPVAGYTMKGAIWYQGESNVGDNQYYNELFEAMIEEWRAAWNQGDFPFLFVQLANYLDKQEKPIDSGWARLREAQTQTLSLAHTGMAVTIDIGDADDIHPRNKQDVGYRLWRSAQKVAFGEQLVYSGPMYAGHIVDENKIRLGFNNEGSGLITKGANELDGFAIAGSDQQFHWADARIEGNQIVVWSPKVEHPVAVRYAWADNPDASLYNEEGLPAVPFRTDNWD